MKKISLGEKHPKITNIITKRPLPDLEAYVGELTLHNHQLLYVTRGAERNTQLTLFVRRRMDWLILRSRLNLRISGIFGFCLMGVGCSKGNFLVLLAGVNSKMIQI
jgi:hypothetical protein